MCLKVRATREDATILSGHRDLRSTHYNANSARACSLSESRERLGESTGTQNKGSHGREVSTHFSSNKGSRIVLSYTCYRATSSCPAKLLAQPADLLPPLTVAGEASLQNGTGSSRKDTGIWPHCQEQTEKQTDMQTEKRYGLDKQLQPTPTESHTPGALSQPSLERN
jgi:hypothetical protein